MPSQNQLLIAIGGTGKSVALVYRKLARLFDEPADVIVLDMPFGGEAIDKLLNEEGVPQQNYLTPWPDGASDMTGMTFDEVIGVNSGAVDRPVGHTLFAEEELSSLIAKGMNCRPIVGATIAMRKFWAPDQDPQLLALREKISQYNDIFLAGSIAGGTGAGVMPTLARWLTEVCKKKVHGIVFLPWIRIGAGTGSGPSDAVMQANTYAVLSYLEQVASPSRAARNLPPFKDYVIIGSPSNLDLDSTATSGNHPLHLVAATYILYFDQIMNKNPEQAEGAFYIEIPAGGLRESDLQPTKGFSLEHAIFRQIWYQEVLNNLAAQKPDQAWDNSTLPYFANFLAPRVLRESVREIAVSFGGHPERGNIWNKMKEQFNEASQVASERIKQIETITSRDSNHLVYNIDWDLLKQQASGLTRRVRRQASKVRTPDFNKQVTMLASAEEAARAIAKDVFRNLGKLAGSITKGGRTQQDRAGSSTVFLPPGIQNPTGVTDFTRQPLNNVRALINRYATDNDAVNMPEPQARRFQFVNVLRQALTEYSQSPSPNQWDSTEALAQFTALLEGVILGKLQIRIFDLEKYGFKSSHERRLLGVLVDKNGEVYGGTDPETLFFPAPEAWQAGTGLLKHLSDENTMQRNTNVGRYARSLLKRFRDTLPADNRPLWLEALDAYLDVYSPPPNTDENALKSGWKQVGPVLLRFPNNRFEVRYLPVFEADFFRLAIAGLSEALVSRNDEILLRSNSTDIGAIYYPRQFALGLNVKIIGAGRIDLLPGARGAATKPDPQINYPQLRQTCESLIHEAAGTAEEIASNPFSYPDVIRLAFEQDGFLAEPFLRGDDMNGQFGEHFLKTVRGQALAMPPLRDPGQQLPHRVRNGNYYMIDQGSAVYVERYQNLEIQELSLLGQALWLIFTGQATQVQGTPVFVDSLGALVLEQTHQRIAPGSHLQLIAPDQSQRVAELRGLAYFISQPNTDALFREAVQCWLDYFGLQPSAAECSRNSLVIGKKLWWRP